MTSERRLIKIRVSPRVLENNPEYLQQVADDFKDENLEFDLVDDSEDIVAPKPSEPTVADEALKIADFVLEKINQEYANGSLTPKSPDEVQEDIKSWRELIHAAGVKFVVEVIFDKLVGYGPQVVDAVYKTFGSIL